MKLDQRIDRLQDITVRLRHGGPVEVVRVLRNDGLISGAEKRTVPFDPRALVAEGLKLNAELKTASLGPDERTVHAAAMVDFSEAAARYAAPSTAASMRRASDSLRSHLTSTGVRL